MKQWCESQGKVQFQNTLLVLESLSERQGVPGTQTLVAATLEACSTIRTFVLISTILESSLYPISAEGLLADQ